MVELNIQVRQRCNASSLGLILIYACVASLVNAEIHYHEFVVQSAPVKRLCKTHSIITVNGQYPGPTLEVRDGDTLVIKVLNRARYNATIHWHGIRQLGTPWADGPEYVTQCPIQTGATYTYRYTIENQEGTLWWHAHSRWLRATVFGALIIYPKLGSSYPFAQPKIEIPILLEWWNQDPILVQQLATLTGGAPNISNAYTINGQPGDLYRCSSRDTVKFFVEYGDTILLRIINAALNQQLFFTVANHELTVVGADDAYTKPFTTRVLMLGPAQTTTVLLTADQTPGRYYIAVRAYASARNAPFNNTTASAILEYRSAPCNAQKGLLLKPTLPRLPTYNDTVTVTAFTGQLKSHSDTDVPTQIDENLFFTVGFGIVNCVPSPQCQGPNNTRFSASMNNVSFVLPRTSSMLQAHYQGIPGVFTTDFPALPPIKFDYTAIFSTEDHPMHLHGYTFYVIAQGFGNFNPNRDAANYNLVDPPRRNTIDVPVGGWAVIRFIADNPGVWLMHCHIDAHLTWGLAMAFLVEDGDLQSVGPPPLDLPQC